MRNNQLIAFLGAIKSDIIHALQENSIAHAGQIAKQITVDGSLVHAKLQLPGYLQFIKTGKSPGKATAAQLKPPVMQRLKHSQRKKGISANAVPEIEQAIKGPGLEPQPSIISSPLSEININSRLNPCLNEITNKLSVEICGMFDQFNKQSK